MRDGTNQSNIVILAMEKREELISDVEELHRTGTGEWRWCTKPDDATPNITNGYKANNLLNKKYQNATITAIYNFKKTFFRLVTLSMK